MEDAARASFTLALAAYAFARVFAPSAEWWLVLVALTFIVPAFGLAKLLSLARASKIVLEDRGLRILTDGRGWLPVAYADIADVGTRSNALRLELRDPRRRAVDVPLGRKTVFYASATDDERRHLATQVVSAVQRARGLGPLAPSVEEGNFVHRRPGEALTDWLARLDACRPTAGSGGGGYRAVAVDIEALWALLENQDAPALWRGAAARVLAAAANVDGARAEAGGVADARPRIDATLAAVRDPAAQRRIRILLDDDTARAAAELERLEDDEALGGRKRTR